MKFVTILIGVFIFAVMKPVFLLISGQFGAPATAAMIQHQLVVGAITGLVTMPAAVYVFEQKWARIALCTALSSSYGALLFAYVEIQANYPMNRLIGPIGFTFFFYAICGFASGWLTMVVAEAVGNLVPRLKQPVKS
jgi:hypothetical protein